MLEMDSKLAAPGVMETSEGGARVPRLLLVEDDADIRDALVDVLQSENWTVEVAPNGRVALDRLGRDPAPDVMLLDLMMPEVDGLEFERACAAPRRRPSSSPPAARWTGCATIPWWATLGKPVEVDVLLGLLDELRPDISSQPTDH
jgi:CheY-like chemotaxis protein